jgi:OmpA-OmpF porin, OOP family
MGSSLENGTLWQEPFENARFGDDNVIFFRKAMSRQGIVPLIKENQHDYLPDAFTVEFDAYFEAGVYNQIFYYVNFYDMKNQRRTLGDMRFYINKAVYEKNEGSYPGVQRTHIDDNAKWRRVSISFNHRALKVYLDDARLLNISNITVNPTGITIRGNNPQGNHQSLIKKHPHCQRSSAFVRQIPHRWQDHHQRHPLRCEQSHHQA